MTQLLCIQSEEMLPASGTRVTNATPWAATALTVIGEPTAFTTTPLSTSVTVTVRTAAGSPSSSNVALISA